MAYKLKRKSEVVDIEDEEGEILKYSLRELSGKGRDSWMKALGDRLVFENGKPTGIKDISGLSIHLLSVTLYDENNDLVTKEVLEEWPAQVIEDLFARSQKLNALDLETASKQGNG